MEGTYPLPEAQLDRFMFNVVIDYLPEDDEVAVVKQTTSRSDEADRAALHRRGRAALPRSRAQGADRRGHRAHTRCGSPPPRARSKTGTPDFVNDWVSWGAGTRAAQFLVLGAKARALLQGRAHVTDGRHQALAVPVLRHRILLNYRAEAEGVNVENVVERLLTARG